MTKQRICELYLVPSISPAHTHNFAIIGPPTPRLSNTLPLRCPLNQRPNRLFLRAELQGGPARVALVEVAILREGPIERVQALCLGEEVCDERVRL